MLKDGKDTWLWECHRKANNIPSKALLMMWNLVSAASLSAGSLCLSGWKTRLRRLYESLISSSEA